MQDDGSLARQVDAASRSSPRRPALEARRLEQALAACCQAVRRGPRQALARLRGRPCTPGPPGSAIFAGAGSPLTQGSPCGLRRARRPGGPRRHRGRTCAPPAPGPRRCELCPFADPQLPALLAARGYRVTSGSWSGPAR